MKLLNTNSVLVAYCFLVFLPFIRGDYVKSASFYQPTEKTKVNEKLTFRPEWAVVPISKCALQCRQEPCCTGFDYNTTTSACTLVRESRTLMANNRSVSDILHYDVRNGSSVECDFPRCQFDEDGYYRNASPSLVTHIGGTSSKEDCCARCLQATDCGSFNYFHTDFQVFTNYMIYEGTCQLVDDTVEATHHGSPTYAGAVLAVIDVPL